MLRHPYYLAAALFAFGLLGALVLMPLAMALARRLGAVDRGGYRKIASGGTPLMGGLSIAIPLLFICFLASGIGLLSIRNWEWIVRYHRPWLDPLLSLASHRRDFFILGVGGLGILALGILDDVVALRARLKLAGQVVVALFLCFQGYVLETIAIPTVGTVSLHPALGWFITIFWVVGLINALNLIDGLDGLAAGASLIIAVGFTALAILSNSYLMLILFAALGGGCLGFLRYNFHPARAFLGDTGSMFLGFVLAGASLVGAYKSQTAIIVLAPILALGFPIAETLISMARRFLQGKPIFSADQRHTHHRLLRMGFSQRQAVLLLYGVTLLCTIAAVISQIAEINWLPIGLYLAALLAIAWVAGYLRLSMFASFTERRQRNRTFSALSRYVIASVQRDPDAQWFSEMLRLVCKQLGLRSLRVYAEEGGVAVASCSMEGDNGPENLGEGGERLRIRGNQGQRLTLRYHLTEERSEHYLLDVAACLANIFESVSLEPAREEKRTDSPER